MSDALHIDADLAAVAGILLDQTALRSCTTYDFSGTGIVVTPNWSPKAFSTGEKELWHALCYFAEHGAIPAMGMTHLDESNQRALADARAILAALQRADVGSPSEWSA